MKELDILPTATPNFEIKCLKCGQINKVEIENRIGHSDESGDWGSIDFICVCGNRTEVISC